MDHNHGPHLGKDWSASSQLLSLAALGCAFSPSDKPEFCFDQVELCTDCNHTVVKVVVVFREAARAGRVISIVAVTAGHEAVVGYVRFGCSRTAAVGRETGVAHRNFLGWAGGLTAAG